MKIIFASRESRLAVAQARQVMDAVAGPGVETALWTTKTMGDRILDRPLDTIGGKGLFVRELDEALRFGRADYAVHSCKDLPMDLPEDMEIAAYTRREDPRDALVLPLGAEVPDFQRPLGCGSLRRRLQLRAIYPNATVKGIRGNITTRLEKLDRGEYGALILAAAGLKRLGLSGRIYRYFSVEEMLPAAGQGILAIQCRRGADTAPLETCKDPVGTVCAQAERAFVRALGGGCTSPVAAYAEAAEGRIFIRGLYVGEDDRLCQGSISGAWADGEKLAADLAARLKGEAKCREK